MGSKKMAKLEKKLEDRLADRLEDDLADRLEDNLADRLEVSLSERLERSLTEKLERFLEERFGSDEGEAIVFEELDRSEAESVAGGVGTSPGTGKPIKTPEI